MCLFVFPHDILKTDTAWITKVDADMVHHESWKYIYFEVERSKVKVTRYKKRCRHHGALVMLAFSTH